MLRAPQARVWKITELLCRNYFKIIFNRFKKLFKLAFESFLRSSLKALIFKGIFKISDKNLDTFILENFF